jgi:hypothetical protein
VTPSAPASAGRPPDAGADRGFASVGVALLLAVAVVLAAAVGAVALSIRPAEPPPQAAFAADADAETGEITVVHRGGDAIAPDRLRMRIRVDGEPIARQPTVPFFSARGFESGPTGPLNRGWRGPWTVGTAASLRLAATNTPIDRGSVVEIRLVVGRSTIAVVEARA